VIGKPIAEARQLIRAAHLQTAAHIVPSYLPAGTVVAQDPSAGTQTLPTLVVSVSVSNGVAPIHTLPDVVGLTSDAATSTLGAIHVFVTVVDQAVKKASNDGIVLSMDPVGGTKVKEGSSVTLVVGVGPKPPSPSPSPSPSPKPGKGNGNGNGHGGGGGGNAAIAFVTRAAP
jgi:serine/threonine-protein kinase